MPKKEISEIENIDVIKKAIEAEINHRYIDIRGRKSTFSRFILNELSSIMNANSKSVRWKNLFNIFEGYSTSDLPTRMKAIKQLIKYLQDPVDKPEPVKKKQNTSTGNVRNPEDVDVMYVKGVGPKISLLLNKLGIFTANDLLYFYPRKHLDYATRTKVSELKPGEEVTIWGTIKSVNAFSSARKPNLTILNIDVYDGTGVVSASWFYGKCNKYLIDRYKAQYPKGANIILSGVVKLDNYSGKMMVDKPQAEVLSGDFEDSSSLNVGRIVPVYSSTENLNIKFLRKAIFNAIDTYLPLVDDILPEYIIQKFDFMDKRTAIKQIHFPDSMEYLEKARKRLIFDELFLIQLKMALLRKQYRINNEGLILNIKEDGLVKRFVSQLPFTLTNAQESAFREIMIDLQKPEPMQRLLQGDVGSGKTVVAAMSLLSAVENGYQAAIMAPTEILAEQHYKNFVNWLTPLGISIGLFVGKHGVKIRRELQQNLKNGMINIAVGTHALIQENIEFNNLGLVVIDEQHRFGVKQRNELKNKGKSPELLTMTATPIPRTLSLTLHGDLDITVIDEMPPGRKPVKTALVTPSERKKAYSLIRKEVEKGHQAYIVFPLIDESETLSAKAATKEAERLQETVFSDLKIGLVHGKLSATDKDKIMEDFRAGKYHILVSTTVIEVGVDVPNSTVMIIENSERFGLSQLHQLRGRVGRGAEQAYCVLVTESKNQSTKERLNVMTQTNNGFIIAEKDLEIRGPGEFMGTKQSGIPDLILADIVRDAEVLELARNTAFDLVKNDDITNYPALCKKVTQKVEEGLELISSG